MPKDGITFETARAVLTAQPFSELIGARLTVFAPGEAVLEIDIDDRHRQQFGLVHGGVLAYAADNALTFAAGTVLGPSVITTGLTIDYLYGARTGLLRARARVARHDRLRAVCQAEIHLVRPDHPVRLCALAQGTIASTQREETS
jgi:uncharacterized protein (TIGR00369 family)